jgi:hypothetical protein
MNTLDEIIPITYKSMAILWGCSRNKWSIVKEYRKQAQLKQYSYPIGSDDYIRWEKIKDRWADLSVRIIWACNFFKGNYGGYGNGVYNTLTHLWETMGNSIDTLIDFESYDNLQILTPISFSEEPTSEIISLEDTFENEDSIFRIDIQTEEEFQSLYKTIFNYSISDMYAGMGMGIWMDTVLDRTTVINDSDYILSIWDSLVEGSRNFLYMGRNCMAETEIESVKYFNNIETDERTRYTIRSKYIRKNEDSMISHGGIFAINKSKLTTEWQEKINNAPLEYI